MHFHALTRVRSGVNYRTRSSHAFKSCCSSAEISFVGPADCKKSKYPLRNRVGFEKGEEGETSSIWDYFQKCSSSSLVPRMIIFRLLSFSRSIFFFLILRSPALEFPSISCQPILIYRVKSLDYQTHRNVIVDTNTPFFESRVPRT